MPDLDAEDDETDIPDEWRDYADDEDEAERIEALLWPDLWAVSEEED